MKGGYDLKSDLINKGVFHNFLGLSNKDYKDRTVVELGMDGVCSLVLESNKLQDPGVKFDFLNNLIIVLGEEKFESLEDFMNRYPTKEDLFESRKIGIFLFSEKSEVLKASTIITNEDFSSPPKITKPEIPFNFLKQRLISIITPHLDEETKKNIFRNIWHKKCTVVVFETSDTPPLKVTFDFLNNSISVPGGTNFSFNAFFSKKQNLKCLLVNKEKQSVLGQYSIQLTGKGNVLDSSYDIITYNEYKGVFEDSYGGYEEEEEELYLGSEEEELYLGSEEEEKELYRGSEEEELYSSGAYKEDTTSSDQVPPQNQNSSFYSSENHIPRTTEHQEAYTRRVISSSPYPENYGHSTTEDQEASQEVEMPLDKGLLFNQFIDTVLSEEPEALSVEINIDDTTKLMYPINDTQFSRECFYVIQGTKAKKYKTLENCLLSNPNISDAFENLADNQISIYVKDERDRFSINKDGKLEANKLFSNSRLEKHNKERRSLQTSLQKQKIFKTLFRNKDFCKAFLDSKNQFLSLVIEGNNQNTYTVFINCAKKEPSFIITRNNKKVEVNIEDLESLKGSNITEVLFFQKVNSKTFSKTFLETILSDIFDSSSFKKSCSDYGTIRDFLKTEQENIESLFITLKDNSCINLDFKRGVFTYDTKSKENITFSSMDDLKLYDKGDLYNKIKEFSKFGKKIKITTSNKNFSLIPDDKGKFVLKPSTLYSEEPFSDLLEKIITHINMELKNSSDPYNHVLYGHLEQLGALRNSNNFNKNEFLCLSINLRNPSNKKEEAYLAIFCPKTRKIYIEKFSNYKAIEELFSGKKSLSFQDSTEEFLSSTKNYNILRINSLYPLEDRLKLELIEKEIELSIRKPVARFHSTTEPISLEEEATVTSPTDNHKDSSKSDDNSPKVTYYTTQELQNYFSQMCQDGSDNTDEVYDEGLKKAVDFITQSLDTEVPSETDEIRYIRLKLKDETDRELFFLVFFSSATGLVFTLNTNPNENHNVNHPGNLEYLIPKKDSTRMLLNLKNLEILSCTKTSNLIDSEIVKQRLKEIIGKKSLEKERGATASDDSPKGATASNHSSDGNKVRSYSTDDLVKYFTQKAKDSSNESKAALEMISVLVGSAEEKTDLQTISFSLKDEDNTINNFLVIFSTASGKVFTLKNEDTLDLNKISADSDATAELLNYDKPIIGSYQTSLSVFDGNYQKSKVIRQLIGGITPAREEIDQAQAHNTENYMIGDLINRFKAQAKKTDDRNHLSRDYLETMSLLAQTAPQEEPDFNIIEFTLETDGVEDTFLVIFSPQTGQIFTLKNHKNINFDELSTDFDATAELLNYNNLKVKHYRKKLILLEDYSFTDPTEKKIREVMGANTPMGARSKEKPRPSSPRAAKPVANNRENDSSLPPARTTSFTERTTVSSKKESYDTNDLVNLLKKANTTENENPGILSMLISSAEEKPNLQTTSFTLKNKDGKNDDFVIIFSPVTKRLFTLKNPKFANLCDIKKDPNKISADSDATVELLSYKSLNVENYSPGLTPLTMTTDEHKGLEAKILAIMEKQALGYIGSYSRSSAFGNNATGGNRTP